MAVVIFRSKLLSVTQTAIELQPSYALDIHKEIGCAWDAKFNANVRLMFQLKM
jgi:hypothetical protein